jgi:hypothetical protein
MTKSKEINFDGGSFRDPAGRVFRSGDALYRSISTEYGKTFDSLEASGLLSKLQSAGLLIPHKEAPNHEGFYRTIQPELIPFISYPFEWCFSQLKKAAILTLEVQRQALKYGFTLKDSSAYNVQFLHNKPIFIDTLSFKPYVNGTPWDGYKQFCQHFLAPLALMAKRDIRLQSLLRTYIDGVPLDLASQLLPMRTYLSSLLFHIHLHAKSQQKFADSGRSGAQVKSSSVSKNALLGLLDSLEGYISGLNWSPKGTEWADYYSDTNYSEVGLSEKSAIVREFLTTTASASVWDVGANSGYFSKIAKELSPNVVAFDIDPAATEKHFRQVYGKDAPLPLVMDLTNPTPGYGWGSAERKSFVDRGPADTALALALVHHLAISNNVPLEMVAEFFGRISKNLIIEFVPKEDSQVKRLLASREDIFPEYTKDGFEAAFSKVFKIERSEVVKTSLRTIYLMRRLSA